jgi:hypothetical protein
MSNSRFVKQEAERRVLNAFKQAYSKFPEGTVKHGDRPDTIVFGPRKIGIELTGFDLVDGSDPDGERQQSVRRNGVVKDAQRLYNSNGGKPVELTFGFDRISQQRRKALPSELAAFATRIEDKVSETIILEFDDAPQEVKFAWNAGRYQNPIWQAKQVYRVGLMDKDRLEIIIREKETKAGSYEPCDAYWLLIFVNFFNPAQEQDVRIDDPYVRSTAFEKIFVFKSVFNHIREVQ